MFGVKNSHLTPFGQALWRTSRLRPSINGMLTVIGAGFVRCLFLSFKRTARRVSLNLTAHNFVDELS